MEILEEYLGFAKDIAKYAGKVMMKYFKQNNGASYKGDKTIVTLADTEINSYLIKQANKNYRNAVTVANLRGYNVYTYRKRR